MNTEEKVKAIRERVPTLGDEYTAEAISMMVIFGYLRILTDNGMVMPSHDLTPTGKAVVAVCEEFDWKPSNEDIELFVNDMVEEENRPAFRHFITQLRDNREGLLDSLKKFNEKRKNGEF